MAGPALSPIPENIIEKLKASVHGELIRPGDPAYESARRIWNASVDKHPALIARCSGVADVIACVNFARENAVPVSVRGGGHNVAGRAICEGGLVIDLSLLRGVHVNAKHRRVRVEAGALLGDLDRETHLFGLAVPAGVVSKTGVAGLTLGGGVGWLVRKYGLTCDNVISFDLVTADGKPITASADENPDLYWALRGGGGNFGVVTSFEFQAHPVATVLGGMVIHLRDQAEGLLRFYRDFVRSVPDELTVYAALLRAPDGTPVVAVVACYCGELSEGEKVLQPLRAFGSPIADTIQPMPFPQMQWLLDASFPDGNHNYWKSAFLPELGDAAIDLLIEHAGRAPSPLSAVVIEYYGGAAGRVPVDATAFPHRGSDFNIGILGQWTDGADSPRQIQWARGLAQAMRPLATGSQLVNFLGEEDEDTVKAAFGPNYARLAEVKRKYDPSNFFRMTQNIKPAD